MTEEQRALVTRVAEQVKDTQPIWSAALKALLEASEIKADIKLLQADIYHARTKIEAAERALGRLI